MCDDCTDAAYAWGYETADALTNALEEIADLHTGDWTPTRLSEGAALCKECAEWWPCDTFLLAVGAMNDVR